MNRIDLPDVGAAQARCDAFGAALVARLGDGSHELSPDISERLRVARSQAVARCRKPARQAAAAVVRSGAVAALTSGDEKVGFWSRLIGALPLLALAAGLFAINLVQNDHRVNELAEIDAALLTDDLPPAAYADPGFVQFLKSSRDQAQ